MRFRRSQMALCSFVLVVIGGCGAQEVVAGGPSTATRQPLPLANRLGRTPPPVTTTTFTLDRLEPIVRYLEMQTTTTLPPAKSPVAATTPPTLPALDASVAAGASCPPDIANAIRAAWAGTGDEEWFIAKAWSESRCTAGAYNAGEACDGAGSHASGILQMCLPLHQAIFAAVGCDWSTQWDELACGLSAARRLYEGVGRSAWGG